MLQRDDKLAAAELAAPNTGPPEVPRRTRFRRLWTRGRAIWYLVALAAVTRLFWTLLRDASLDPMAGALEAGPCHIVSVAADGTLDVVQPAAGELAVNEKVRRGTVRRVRLLGVRLTGGSARKPVREPTAPSPDGSPVEWLREAVGGRDARLEFDRRRFDDEGYWLAYVYVNDRLVNVELVRAGWGRCEVVPGDSATKQRDMRRAENEARSSGRGAWGRVDRELVPARPPG